MFTLLYNSSLIVVHPARVLVIGCSASTKLISIGSCGPWEADWKAEVLEPPVGPVAETVHRAVEMNRRDGFVGVEDALERLKVLVPRRAFIVDDDVVALGPIRIVVNGQRRSHRLVVRPPDIDLNVGPGLDALEQDFVLGRVVMATAAGDDEGLERGRFRGSRQGRGKEEGEDSGRSRSCMEKWLSSGHRPIWR